MAKYKYIPLEERWQMDIEAYEKGLKPDMIVWYPQCGKCKYQIKGNARYCEKYIEKEKPEYVRLCNKECLAFETRKPINIKPANEAQSKLYGAIFGFCVGDMLGVPLEFSTRQQRNIDAVEELRAFGTYHQPFGTWSDDTSLILCLISAINDGFSIRKLSKNMIRFYKNATFTPDNQVFDIGISTRKAIKRMILGINPLYCGGKRETENGNGALMRILPLAFLKDKCTEEEFIKFIEDVCSLTHRHKRSKLACIFYIVFAIQLLEGKDKAEAYDYTIDYLVANCKKGYSSEFKHFKDILNKQIIGSSVENIKSTGYVIDTLEAVLWCFFQNDTYEKMVLCAVNLGGDTDTIAALVGGLAGIYYGFTSIPDRWVQNVAKKEEIEEMIRIFSLHIQDAQGRGW